MIENVVDELHRSHVLSLSLVFLSLKPILFSLPPLQTTTWFGSSVQTEQIYKTRDFKKVVEKQMMHEFRICV